MDEQIMSPSPQVNRLEPATFSFPAAAIYLIHGGRIHKLEWEDQEFYGVLDGGVLKLHKPDGNLYQWILSDTDLLGEDYIILPDSN